MYQYVGIMCATVKTLLGSHSTGTKAPHKKLEPSAITFTIPFIAFLLFTIVAIKNAIVKAHIVNINEFTMYIKPRYAKHLFSYYYETYYYIK